MLIESIFFLNLPYGHMILVQVLYVSQFMAQKLYFIHIIMQKYIHQISTHCLGYCTIDAFTGFFSFLHVGPF